MKLLDLLLQELPKRGGWPDGCHYISQYKHGELCYHKANKYCLKAVTGVCLEPHEEGDETGWAYGVYVSREQYEAALNKQVWSGEGLPPVGTECEVRYRHGGGDWEKFKCLAVDKDIAFGWCEDEPVTLPDDCYEFRPIRTEADKRRDAALDAIYGAIASAERAHNRSDEADKVYEAIAAGKIPGVKLED